MNTENPFEVYNATAKRLVVGDTDLASVSLDPNGGIIICVLDQRDSSNPAAGFLSRENAIKLARHILSITNATKI